MTGSDASGSQNGGVADRGMAAAHSAAAGMAFYPWPAKLMMGAINDLIELQRAEVTFTDIPQGRIHFQIEMYGFAWEYRFTVEDRGESGSCVTLNIDGEVMDPTDKVTRQFALLDSLLPGETQENLGLGLGKEGAAESPARSAPDRKVPDEVTTNRGSP
jgi:hypothetical protein